MPVLAGEYIDFRAGNRLVTDLQLAWKVNLQLCSFRLWQRKSGTLKFWPFMHSTPSAGDLTASWNFLLYKYRLKMEIISGKKKLLHNYFVHKHYSKWLRVPVDIYWEPLSPFSFLYTLFHSWSRIQMWLSSSSQHIGEPGQPTEWCRKLNIQYLSIQVSAYKLKQNFKAHSDTTQEGSFQRF